LSRLLLFAATTGYQTRSFAAAARRAGAEVTLATDRCHVLDDPWRDSAIPVRFDEPAALDVPGIDGIVAVADAPTVAAAMTAERLGISWHPAGAAAICRNKRLMREAFRAAGLPSPARYMEAAPRFPCVVKPVGLSASRGVIRANNQTEFDAAVERVQRISGGGDLEIEAYIPGREFAIEGLMTRGKLAPLALFDKPDPLEGPFFEETIYVTPSPEAPDVQQAILDSVRAAARAIGLWHGPIHAEARVNETGVYMLEVAARPIGGLCAPALTFQGGLNLEDVVVLHALGKTPSDLRPAAPASGVMMIPVPGAGIFESVSGVEEARSIPGIADIVITAKPGEKLTPLPEGASYTGFLFAHGESPDFVEKALREAHARLRFDILASLKVVS